MPRCCFVLRFRSRLTSDFLPFSRANAASSGFGRLCGATLEAKNTSASLSPGSLDAPTFEGRPLPAAALPWKGHGEAPALASPASAPVQQAVGSLSAEVENHRHSFHIIGRQTAKTGLGCFSSQGRRVPTSLGRRSSPRRLQPCAPANRSSSILQAG